MSSGDKLAEGPCYRAPYIGGFGATLFATPVRDAELCRRGHFLTSIPADAIWMTNTGQTVFEGPLRQLARSAWRMLLLIGLAAVALGVIVLVWPGKTRSRAKSVTG
ncbi:hypothetical protein [Mycolicibacterium vulneris]|uniref:hypothetical protein n=1 Tax=Mycolicibacterium vulneris TaxID=547163 RepID=UPI0015E886DF|nr:hypothetical protein [Mycolicibacterium vulneris]